MFLVVTARCLAQQPPSVSTQPQSRTNWFGTTASFTVQATGTEPLAYQWQRDSGFLDFYDLSGCTTTDLCLTNVQTSDAASYRVIVTNAFGTATSVVATLTVITPPQISSVRNVYVAGSVGTMQRLLVVASGTAPLSYQWLKESVLLAGQTNNFLSFPSVQLADLGFYSVIVTNVAGAVTSNPVRLNVDPTFTKITTGALVTDTGSSWGCGWADFDSDGLLDLAVVLESGIVRFYHNLGNGSFSSTVETVGGWLGGLSWGDFDNDGYPDCLVPGWDSTNVLFRSKGDGTFARVAAGDLIAGLATVYPGGWADYDNDGYLDVFVAGSNAGQKLYRNDGDSTFTRITNSSLVKIWTASPQGIAWGDYNNDGRLDVFISIGFGAGNNLLFRNDGNGQFTQITGAAPVTAGARYWDTPSWADWDNDGDLDLYNDGGDTSYFFRNNGDGTFTRIIQGMPQTDACAAAWGDYDNDGFLDVFLARQGGLNAFYHNNGDGTFTKITTGSPALDSSASITPVWGDDDNDGFLDLFVANSGAGARNFFYRNNGNTNHWLKVKLVGTVSNRSAIGAKVRVLATIRGQTMWQMREVSIGSGVGNNELNPHFGLGDATTVETVRIEWPSGAVQELKNVPVGQFLTVTEPARLETIGAGQFRIRSWKGMAFTVEASPDLTNWSPLGAVTNETGVLTFSDPASATLLQQFYRVKSK
jgi:hypothetical protein